MARVWLLRKVEEMKRTGAFFCHFVFFVFCFLFFCFNVTLPKKELTYSTCFCPNCDSDICSVSLITFVLNPATKEQRAREGQLSVAEERQPSAANTVKLHIANLLSPSINRSVINGIFGFYEGDVEVCPIDED